MSIKIFSRESDITTDLVIDWLHYFGAKYERISPKDFYGPKNKISFNLQDSSQEGESIWVRNWDHLRFNECHEMPRLHHNVMRDTEAVLDLIAYQIDNDVRGSLQKHVSKPIQLKMAEKSGLLVPETLITNSKDATLEFAQRHKKIIVKPISDAYTKPPLEKEGSFQISYTRELKINEIQKLPEIFGYSLFQPLIPKSYEVRSFIYEKNIWSMAIFSQNSDKTAVDFRNYDQQKPNRRVPIKLDRDVGQKVFTLMSELGLTSGSLDFVVDKEENFWFLEVNPQGQIGMVSTPCNYNIEKTIAKSLIAESNGKWN